MFLAPDACLTNVTSTAFEGCLDPRLCHEEATNRIEHTMLPVCLSRLFQNTMEKASPSFPPKRGSLKWPKVRDLSHAGEKKHELHACTNHAPSMSRPRPRNRRSQWIPGVGPEEVDQSERAEAYRHKEYLPAAMSAEL